MKFAIVFATFVLPLIVSQSNIPITECEISIVGKCLQDLRKTLDKGYPESDAGLITTVTIDSYDSCGTFCNKNLLCFMAGYNVDDHNCSLYERIDFVTSFYSNIKLYLFVCCDTNSSFRVPHRCPGFWKHKSQTQTQNTIRIGDPIRQFQGIDIHRCQMECLDNPICGAVNFRAITNVDLGEGNCELIIKAPVEGLVLVSNQAWETFLWECAFNYTLPSPGKECQQRIGHRDGYWTIGNSSIPLTKGTESLINFYSLDYRQCLDNCALYSQCSRAWYSENSSYCVLEGDSTSTCKQEMKDNRYIYTTFIWELCSTFRRDSQINLSHDQRWCRTLTDNRYTYIYPINCGQLPDNVSESYPCWSLPSVPHGTKFSYNLHCQINQSFQSMDIERKFSFSNVTWWRVYNGYESFWLGNVTEENFPLTTSRQCEIFNANMDVPDSPSFRIIKRTEWFAPKPKGPEFQYPNHPVDYVFISDTEQPYCNCFSIEACSSIMRTIQMTLIFPSIPYSFIVTGDGVVYEGRGWDWTPQIAKEDYDFNCVAIALCGRYKHNPDVAALLSVKKIIRWGMDLGKVSRNYTLYIYNDVMDRPYPYDGLRQVIELWPHYRGHTKADCDSISVITIVISIIFSLVLVVILLAITHHFIHRFWHNKNCHQIRSCRIETIYCNHYEKSTEILPQILTHNIKDLSSTEKWMSPLTSSLFWIEDYTTILETDNCACKSGTFSLFNLCRMRLSLVNISTLQLLPELRHCSKTIAFVFQRNRDVGKECLFVLHFRFVKSFDNFIFSLHQNKCICDHFHLTEYRFQAFDTENWCISGVSDSMDKRSVRRDGLQEKYSFIRDSNHTTRFHY